jgi:hypothetical protein
MVICALGMGSHSTSIVLPRFTLKPDSGTKFKLTHNMAQPGKCRLLNPTNLASNRVPTFLSYFDTDLQVIFHCGPLFTLMVDLLSRIS